jgi:hypothetical protein
MGASILRLAVPQWHKWNHRVRILGLDEKMSTATLRDARDASTAHLEAVLKVNGASYLRLAHLRDQLDVQDDIELKAGDGVQPQLWLDMAHRFTMEPDAKTYRLAYHGASKIEVLLETDQLESAVSAAKAVLAHKAVRELRGSSEPSQTVEWQWMTLLYVWMTGVITGFAALSLYAIYMKKLLF